MINVPGLLLQQDRKATNNSWAKLNGEFSELSEFSICMYIKFISQKTSYDTILSYAVEDNANELFLGK